MPHEVREPEGNQARIIKTERMTDIMKRRFMMAALLCLTMMAAGCSNGNTKTTETGAGTEAATEAASEAETGAQTDTAAAKRPDYKALDYVTLGEYKGLPVTLASTAVTDEEIDAEISSTLSQSDKMETLEEGTVENGDIANIDYEGTKDGVAFDGGTDKGYDLSIGSGTFIEGFEEGLIGKKVGESVDLNLTFPENYGSTELAGQDVVFHVTINSIKRAPELTDELAAELSDSEYKTVDAYRENVRKTLQEQKASTRDSQKTNDLMTQVYNNATINDYPEDLVAFMKDQYVDYYAQYAAQSEMELSDFIEQNLQTTEEDFYAQMEEMARQGLRQEMLLKAIAEAEELALDDTEYQERAQKYVDMMGLENIEALENQYGKKVVETNLLLDKALELVEENAVVTDPDEADTEAETGSEAESETESETGAE